MAKTVGSPLAFALTEANNDQPINNVRGKHGSCRDDRTLKIGVALTALEKNLKKQPA